MSNVPWKLSDGQVIYLLTPEEFAKLPDGTDVVSINGAKKVKGRDHIDDDTTRSGLLAYGVLTPLFNAVRLYNKRERFIGITLRARSSGVECFIGIGFGWLAQLNPFRRVTLQALIERHIGVKMGA